MKSRMNGNVKWAKGAIHRDVFSMSDMRSQERKIECDACHVIYTKTNRRVVYPSGKYQICEKCWRKELSR